MMISYMIDGQGYLITNREIISAGTISKKNRQIYKDTKFKHPAKIVSYILHIKKYAARPSKMQK